MDSYDTLVTSTTFYQPSSPPQSSCPPLVVISPCAACKTLRRRCVEKCVLAPYFPPTEPLKFITAHRVFGASNIIKMLQELPEPQRADAASSMVYEANERTRYPVYGTAGTIWQLHKQVNELQTQLAKVQADMIMMQLQQTSLIAMICKETPNSSSPQPLSPQSCDDYITNLESFTPNFGYMVDNTHSMA